MTYRLFICFTDEESLPICDKYCPYAVLYRNSAISYAEIGKYSVGWDKSMIMILKSSKTITEIKEDMKGSAVYNLSYDDYLKKLKLINTHKKEYVPKCAMYTQDVPKCTTFNINSY